MGLELIVKKTSIKNVAEDKETLTLKYIFYLIFDVNNSIVNTIYKVFKGLLVNIKIDRMSMHGIQE